ncbi:TetR-like C-terminal domain-containing protein, partial [Streptomyces sp. NPDC059515]|uniref:TetR-like C-terminal domain-containing protein n=1 Tax=Streptomyces sp. NPDC059515 TaxID=3346854 RepID=UPI0036B4D54D
GGGGAGRGGPAGRASPPAPRDTPRAPPAGCPPPPFPLDPEEAAGSAGVRHAAMARALLRGYALDEPRQTHAVRLLGSVFSGFVGLEAAGGFSHSAPDAQESWTEILDALDLLLRTWSTTP